MHACHLQGAWQPHQGITLLNIDGKVYVMPPSSAASAWTRRSRCMMHNMASVAAGAPQTAPSTSANSPKPSLHLWPELLPHAVSHPPPPPTLGGCVHSDAVCPISPTWPSILCVCVVLDVVQFSYYSRPDCRCDGAGQMSPSSARAVASQVASAMPPPCPCPPGLACEKPILLLLLLQATEFLRVCRLEPCSMA